MRIGVDAACWSNARGYGRYTRELLTAMVERAPDDLFLFFLDRRTERDFRVAGHNVEKVVVDLDQAPVLAATSADRRSVRDVLKLTRRVAGCDLDVVFFPSVYTYFPIAPGPAVVVGIHDVIADRYPELTLPTWRSRLFWKLKLAVAVRQARTILTVSDHSAVQIARHFGVDRARICVAGEAPASVFRPSGSDGPIRKTASRFGVPAGERWFVYVGGFNPHKRIEVLVRAHAELTREANGSAPYLLLVGAVEEDVFHRYDDAIRREVERAGTSDRVIWTGFVPDEALRHLYSGAIALVLPSQEEGFGLPAVEAAACGTPVIATTASPLPDLLEGGGLFVDPGDIGELAGALRRLTRDRVERDRLGAEARRRAERLTWSTGATAALSALREAAA